MSLAVVTGASSGIGLELARLAAQDGHDLVVCAQEQEIENAAHTLRGFGVSVEAVKADLSTEEGVLALWHAVGAREVDILMANAGTAQGHAFVEQDWPRVREVIGLNVMGTTLLLHRALPRMLARGEGRILVTGSVVGFIPGSFQAVYNASKAYIDSLAFALAEEVKDSAVTITCLMPGAVDTGIFADADMEDTVVGQAPKAGPEWVARKGYEAMLAGASGVTPGVLNKIMKGFTGVLPEAVLAKLHRFMAEPASESAEGHGGKA